MAEWDDLGITKEEYEEAMAGLHDYLQESGDLDAPSDEAIAQMAADMGVEEYSDDHVETQAEYAERMRKESALFRNMPFEQVLQYRIDRKMPLTDADKRLINEKIVDEYEAMSEEYDGAIAYYDAEIDGADARVDRYANDHDAQREVAGAGGNVPAWMTNEYPIDEHGRAYTADELRDIYEASKMEHTVAYEAARDKLFARVYDLHVMTTKPGALPSEVTDGKSANPVITPETFGALGSEFKAYHAEQIRQQLPGNKVGRVNWAEVQNSIDAAKHSVAPDYSADESDVKDELPLTVSGSLPVVDFSRPVVTKPAQMQKDVQSEIVVQQTMQGRGQRQRMADVDIDRQEHQEEVAEKRAMHGVATGRNRGRSGVSAFDGHNSVDGGRSNPDYDFDEFD